MKKRVLDFMLEHHLVHQGDHIVIGVSGGADSVCLLHLLTDLRSQLELNIRAVHVHHGLRGAEADRDANFVKGLCTQLKVPCFVVQRDVAAYAKDTGVSEEEAGRILRYQIFEMEAVAFDDARIAVAHHQDDAAETVIYHLLRGSGLKGMSGISASRDRIIRPLLCCRRSEILHYLDHEGIAYCHDSSNESNQYTRNKIRNQVIPLLISEINEKSVENILNASEMMREADHYLENQATCLLEEGIFVKSDGIGVGIDHLNVQPPIIQKYMVMNLLQRASGYRKDLSLKHVLMVISLLTKSVGKIIHLPHEQLARKDYKIIWIEHIKQGNIGKKNETELQVPIYKQFSYHKQMKIPKNRYTKWFDYDKIADTLSIRLRQTGDYVTLPDGGHKSVKSYMIDEKIPREKRNQIPVLAEKNHVLWIIGYRISEYYKITDITKRILQVQYDGGLEDEG